jgi:hypothetical protein
MKIWGLGCIAAHIVTWPLHGEEIPALRPAALPAEN